VIDRKEGRRRREKDEAVVQRKNKKPTM